MKLTKQLISMVLLTSTTLAIKISNLSEAKIIPILKQIKQLQHYKRGMTIDTFGEGDNTINPFGNSVGSGTSGDITEYLSEECLDSLSKYDSYEECFSIYYLINKMGQENVANEVCTVFNQEKCQNFYQMKLFDTPECATSDDFVKSFVEYIFDGNYLQINVNCGKDEEDKYCPLSEVQLTAAIKESLSNSQNLPKNPNEIEIDYDDATEKTCKSRKCTESLVKFLEGLDKIDQELLDGIKNSNLDEKVKDQLLTEIEEEIEKDPIQNINKYVESGKCSYAEEFKSDSSPSSVIHYSITLFVTLVLILYTF